MGRPARRGKNVQHRDTEQGFEKNTPRNRKARSGAREREGYGEVVQLKVDQFKPKTDGQRLLVASIKTNCLTFADGPAGTGKSHVAIAQACELLKSNKIERIICTKPMCEIDERLGTLPGNDQEKIAVSVKPMHQLLEKMLGSGHLDYLVKAEKVVFAPLGSILGLTFDNAFVLMDESQNSTPAQMKVFLTRVGHNSKVVVAGDAKDQKFIEGLSGLEDALRRLKNKEEVGHVRFTPDDIVRSSFCKEVILAYRDDID
jgi:phosphate starvation-inducible PhoH-like protein